MFVFYLFKRFNLFAPSCGAHSDAQVHNEQLYFLMNVDVFKAGWNYPLKSVLSVTTLGAGAILGPVSPVCCSCLVLSPVWCCLAF